MKLSGPALLLLLALAVVVVGEPRPIALGLGGFAALVAIFDVVRQL